MCRFYLKSIGGRNMLTGPGVPIKAVAVVFAMSFTRFVPSVANFSPSIKTRPSSRRSPHQSSSSLYGGQYTYGWAIRPVYKIINYRVMVQFKYGGAIRKIINRESNRVFLSHVHAFVRNPYFFSIEICLKYYI